MAWHSRATGMKINLTQRHSFSNESSGVAFGLGAGSSISPFDFSLEAPPNPGRPQVGPREPGKVPNEDREQPRGDRSPHALITRPIFHPFLSTPLPILPVTHSYILPAYFYLQHVYEHAAILIYTDSQHLGAAHRSLRTCVHFYGWRQLRRPSLPNLWMPLHKRPVN